MSAPLCACGCGTPLRIAKYPSQQPTWVRGHVPPPTHRDEDIRRRFWSRVEKDGPVPPHRPELGPCWVFTGASKGPLGHARMHVRNRVVLAHRLSWEWANGSIGQGLFVLHHCDNGACVRPEHLFLGTQLDNMRDMVRKGRKAAGERHPMAKLTAQDAAAVRQALAAGEPTAAIAARFGVSRTTVGDIGRGRIWREGSAA